MAICTRQAQNDIILTTEKTMAERPRLITYLDDDVNQYVLNDARIHRLSAAAYIRQLLTKMKRLGVTLENVGTKK
jgi:hypothetical protein